MEKGDARRMDLYTQYAMAAAWQAVNESGILGTLPPEELGVYVGSGIGGYHTSVVEFEKMMNRGPSRVSPLYIPMMIANIATGNIAIKFNAQGPSLPVVTACATSTNAVGEAYRAIKDGYATAIIAGGAEAAIEPMAWRAFATARRCAKPMTRMPHRCRSTSGAPALRWAKAPAYSCSRNSNTPGPAALTYSPKWWDTATPATRIT